MTRPSEWQGRKSRRRRILGWILGIIVGILLALLVWKIHEMLTPKELVRRVICGSNLSGIGAGIALYRAENYDLAPPTLALLIRTNLISPSMLLCPATGTQLPVPESFPSSSAYYDYVCDVVSDYIYVPLGSVKHVSVPEDLICIYELPANHRYYKVNVLYWSRRVRIERNLDLFMKDLQRTNDYYGKLIGTKR